MLALLAPSVIRVRPRTKVPLPRRPQPEARATAQKRWSTRHDPPEAPPVLKRPSTDPLPQENPMRAVWLRDFGPAEHLRIEETADPLPAPNTALVDVAYANITFVETQVRSG